MLFLILFPVTLAIVLAIANNVLIYAALGVVIIIFLLAAIKPNFLIYSLIALWPLSRMAFSIEELKVIWAIILFLAALRLTQKLLSGESFIKPPPGINFFFLTLIILAILSAVNNLTNFSPIDNIRIMVFILTFYIYYDWSYDKPASHIIMSASFALVVSLLILLVALLKNPSLMGIIQLTAFRYVPIDINPNIYGSYLCVFIPLFFAMVINKYESKYFLFIVAILIFSILGLIVSNSRAAYLGVGISILVLSMFKKKSRLIILIGTVLALLIYFSVPFVHQFSDLVLRIDNDPTSGRVVVWGSAIKILTHHPIWGIGLGNEIDTIYENLPLSGYKYIFHGLTRAHNLYLSRAIELGIFAIPLFLFLFYYMGKIVIANLRNSTGNRDYTINLGALGILVALFMRSLFEHSVLLSGGGLFPEFYAWIILALAFRRYKSKRNDLVYT